MKPESKKLLKPIWDNGRIFIRDNESRNGIHFIAPRGHPNSVTLPETPDERLQELTANQRLWFGEYGPLTVEEKK